MGIIKQCGTSDNELNKLHKFRMKLKFMDNIFNS